MHTTLLVLTIQTQSVPWVRDDKRLSVTPLAPNFWRATARFGFMERPDVPRLLQQACAFGCVLQLDDVTYYVGHESIVAAQAGKRVPAWLRECYALMSRNALHVGDFLRLPSQQVVEIGRQVGI